MTLEGKILEGNLPKKQKKIVEAWRVVHEDELKAAWYAYNNDGEIVKIKGLEWLDETESYRCKTIKKLYVRNNIWKWGKKLFDVKPYLKFEPFKELENEKKFRKVKIAGLSIEWENGADICPDELYYNSK